MIVSLCRTALRIRSLPRKVSRSTFAKKPAIASAASTMSARYSSSRLIDHSGAGEHRPADSWFQALFGHDIHLTPEQLGKIDPESGQIHEANLRARLECDQ